MGFIRFQILFLVALIGLVLGTACGGADEIKPTAALTTTAPAVAETPAPAVTTVATTAPAARATGTLESITSNARLGRYELEGIRYGGTFRHADNNTANVPNLDPKISTTGPMATIGSNFYDKLTAYVANEDDALAHMEPMLAESWKISDDLSTYTFKLRQGIRWHNLPPVNGREFVADDVVFNMRRYGEKDSSQALYQGIQSVDALDKYTVVVKLKEPSAWALNDLFGKGEFILSPELVKESGGFLTTSAIGTGPFLLERYQPRRGYLAVRNPDYWLKDKKGNKLPYLDRIENIFMTDFATAIAAMRTGQIHTGTIGTVESLVALANTTPSRVFLTGAMGATTGGSTPSAIAFNTKKAPWDDVRVRRAFNMALDKDTFQKTVSSLPVYQYGWPFPWSLVSDTPFTNDKLGPYYQFNPQEAKKLLIEAGFPGGTVKVGSPLMYSQQRSPNGVVLQGLYRQQGIELPVQVMDDAVFGSTYWEKSHQDLAFTFALASDFTLNFYAQNHFFKDGIQNLSFIRDPKIQQVVSEIKVTTDPVKLRELARILWDYSNLESMYIWLPNMPGFAIYSDRIRNYVGRSGITIINSNFLWLSDAPRTSP